MKGHVRERPPGSGNWSAVLEMRDPETGRRKRKWHSLDAKGKRAAQIECARLISAMDGGTYMEPSKTTVSEFLERWIEHMKAQVSPRTFHRYREICTKNLCPLIGTTTLSKLKPAQLSAAYTTALSSGRRNRSGGLSPRTVHHMHTVLKSALAQAVKWELLARNPADAVDPPRVERQRLETYDVPQTATLIELMRPTRIAMPSILAAMCGLRRGEIAALRWRAIDLAAGQLAVRESAEQTRDGVRIKEPKSGRARTVALSATVVDELRQHRLKQAEELLKLGVRLTEETFVATHADGSPLQPDYITHEWVRQLAKSALPRVRFHDLRHAHATHLLSSGVHPKVASERLGHSTIGITLDLYSHVMPGMQEDAAAKVDAAFQRARQPR